jgi:hypothetical protein
MTSHLNTRRHVMSHRVKGPKFLLTIKYAGFVGDVESSSRDYVAYASAIPKSSVSTKEVAQRIDWTLASVG